MRTKAEVQIKFWSAYPSSKEILWDSPETSTCKIPNGIDMLWTKAHRVFVYRDLLLVRESTYLQEWFASRWHPWWQHHHVVRTPQLSLDQKCLLYRQVAQPSEKKEASCIKSGRLSDCKGQCIIQNSSQIIRENFEYRSIDQDSTYIFIFSPQFSISSGNDWVKLCDGLPIFNKPYAVLLEDKCVCSCL